MVITDNIGGEGGGVYAGDAVLTISDSTISENTALYDGGGGVYSDDTVLTITGTQFIHNVVAYGGGGGGLAVVGETGRPRSRGRSSKATRPRWAPASGSTPPTSRRRSSAPR